MKEALEPKNKNDLYWRPASERPPTRISAFTGRDVWFGLVLVNGHVVKRGKFIDGEFALDRYFNDEDMNREYGEMITHWMPLPQKPDADCPIQEMME